jgi:DNA-directed RNA polymerase specialized sigma24 family protein
METQRINELAGLMKKDVNSSFDEFYELTKKAVYLNLASFIPSRNICEDLEQETYLRFLDSLPKLRFQQIRIRTPLCHLPELSTQLSSGS